MTGTPANLPDTPEGPDLDALRDEIDELKNTPTEELRQPGPARRRGARAHADTHRPDRRRRRPAPHCPLTAPPLCAAGLT
ncbi:hypothetical protein [Microbacterium lacticum]